MGRSSGVSGRTGAHKSDAPDPQERRMVQNPYLEPVMARSACSIMRLTM